MQKITIVFDGRNVTIKTEGFGGGSCKQATADLEKDLGIKTKDTNTQEFYQTTATTLKQSR